MKLEMKQTTVSQTQIKRQRGKACPQTGNAEQLKIIFKKSTILIEK